MGKLFYVESLSFLFHIHDHIFYFHDFLEIQKDFNDDCDEYLFLYIGFELNSMKFEEDTVSILRFMNSK